LDRRGVVILAAVVVAFVVRAVWAWWATRTPLGANDPVTYLGLAERFADGQGYVGPTGAPTAYFPPGYPIALGSLWWLATTLGVGVGLPTLAAAFNVVLGTATVGLMAVLAGRLFGWRVAVVVAWILALFPTLIGYSSLALSEPLFLFLVSLALTVALCQPLRTDRPAAVRLVVASVLLGAALLVRPVGGLLVVALLIGLALAGGGRVALARGALVVGVVALVLVPWAVRNASVLDVGLTLSTNTGDNLCIGNNPAAGGTLTFPDECFADLPAQEGPADVAEAARARETQTRAVEWIKANPLAQPRLVVLRTAGTFQNGHEFRWASQSYGADLWLDDPTVVLIDWVADLAWFGLIALGLCGAPILWDRRDPRRMVLLLSIVGLALATWPFFGNARFGVPAVALLTVPAALVVSALPEVWARARRGVDGDPDDDHDPGVDGVPARVEEDEPGDQREAAARS
jgi:4-amino-4-deoxy-L-arabinose transferase-like glycosyltransferase